MSYTGTLYTQNIDSFAHLIDRLVVENIKLADFVRRLEMEQESPNGERDLKRIDRLYKGLRGANEARASAKNHLDKLLSDVMAAGEYHVLSEVRTFRLPGDTQEDIQPRKEPGDEFQDTHPAHTIGLPFVPPPPDLKIEIRTEGGKVIEAPPLADFKKGFE